jgi:hypothetical protein
MAELFILEPEDFEHWQKSPGRDGFPPPLEVRGYGGADLEHTLRRLGVVNPFSCEHPEWVAIPVVKGAREKWIDWVRSEFYVA